MTEIDYELILICTTPSAFGTSPKYDMKIIHNHFILDGRIWGRKIGSKQGENYG